MSFWTKKLIIKFESNSKTLVEALLVSKLQIYLIAKLPKPSPKKMISIPSQHYQHLISLIKSLHTNFTLLLHQQSKQHMQQLFQEFVSLNTTLLSTIESVSKQSEQHKIVLLQYESELNLLRHKCHGQHESMKSHELEVTKLRQELSKAEKEYNKLRETHKQLKQELSSKESSIAEIQEHFKAQLKAIKKEYRQENKDLKERVKQLQEMLKTAILTNDSKEKEIELDKELQELKKYQLQ